MAKRRSHPHPSNSVPVKPRIRVRIRHVSQGTPPIAYIHRLPHELLLDIFDLLADTSDHQCVVLKGQESMVACEDADQKGKHLFVLTSICKTWRQIMIHTSRFWSTIICHIGDKTNMDHMIARTECSLDRSQKDTVSISIDLQHLCYGLDEHGVEALPSLFALLLRSAPRWRSFTMLSEWYPYFEALLFPSIALPDPLVFGRLTKMTMRHIDQDFIFQDLPEFGKTSVFHRASLPVLETLHLDGYIIPWTDLTSALSTARPSTLKSMTLSCSTDTVSPTAEILHSIVASTPELRTLDLNIRLPPAFNVQSTHHQIHLAHLETLTVHRICPDETTSMLKFFDSPSVPCPITWKEVNPYASLPPPPFEGIHRSNVPFHYPRSLMDVEIPDLKGWDFRADYPPSNVEVRLAPPMDLPPVQAMNATLPEPRTISLVDSILWSLIPPI